MPPHSLMYLLFKSVILVFIATFCECSAPIGFIKKKCSVWIHRILFLDKSLQTRQSEIVSFSLSPLLFCQVNISLLAFLLVENLLAKKDFSGIWISSFGQQNSSRWGLRNNFPCSFSFHLQSPVKRIELHTAFSCLSFWCNSC